MLINILFPKMCVSCGKEGPHVCEDCLSLIPINRSVTADALWAVSFQEPVIQDILHHFKYPPFLKDIALPLASLIIAHFALVDKPYNFTGYTLVPMPLHMRRQKWRGFNQAQEIASHLSAAWSLPLQTDILVKTKYTRPQIELKGIERRENVQGAFHVPNPALVKNKNILLVDDVYTTGASMQEAILTLKKARTRRVVGLVVARG